MPSVIPRQLKNHVKQADRFRREHIVVVPGRNLLDRTSAKEKGEPLLGAHIFVRQKRFGVLYQHHGIYVGNNRVIHVMHNEVRETTLKKFRDMSKSHTYGILHTPRNGSRRKVVERAERALAKKKFRYNLIFSNCEHFARWCRSGQRCL